MKERAMIQSSSRELAVALNAMEIVREDVLNMKKTFGFIPELNQAVNKAVRKLRENRNKKALLQWKLKKYMMGNASYLEESDMQSLRSFLKVAIKTCEDAAQSAKEEQDFKSFRALRKRSLELGKNQRILRQMIVNAGKALRADTATQTFKVGDKVEIIAVISTKELEECQGVSEKFPFGIAEEMMRQKGFLGVVVEKTSEPADGYLVRTHHDPGNSFSFWWTPEQLKGVA